MRGYRYNRSRRVNEDASMIPASTATTPIQRKTIVGKTDDPLEHEADKTADKIMRMPENPFIQRKGSCSCGEYDDDHVHLKPLANQVTPFIQSKNGGAVGDGVASKIQSTKGIGTTLNGHAKSYMESRFGTDFSDVKIHTGDESVQLSSDLNAKAFTVGSDIYFNKDQYQPETDTGKHLLAHELTHVVQQDNMIRRKLQVEDPNGRIPGAPPKQNWEDIKDLITTLSPGFTVSSSGVIAPVSAAVCARPTRTVDHCICDMHNAPDTWKIKIDESNWPQTDEVNKRILIHSSRSQIQFGAWGGGVQSGTRVMQPIWRVLGHELCGHGWLMQQGIHPATGVVKSGGRIMSRPGHDATIDVENKVAKDILGPAAPQRGLHTDVHSGESFGKVTISGFPNNSAHLSGLTPTMRSRIDTIESFMKATAFLKADIVGHADSVDMGGVNGIVSRQRAEGIKSELVGRGINADRFNRVIGVGASECPTPSPTHDPDCRNAEVFMYIFERSSLKFP